MADQPPTTPKTQQAERRSQHPQSTAPTEPKSPRSPPPLPDFPEPSATPPPPPQMPPDYIMLGEFSEQHGPVCLWRIPEPDSQDQRALEAKILSNAMAVDYQSRQGALSNFKEDTKVSSCDPNTGSTQYLHHFTLLDVHARGYVRPMVLAYITYDPLLVMPHFEEMAALFTEVAKLLKRANRLVMRHDIDHRLKDLEFTKEVFRTGQVEVHYSEPPKFQEDAIPEHEADLQQLFKKVESFPEPETLAGEIDAEEAHRLLEEPPYTQKVVTYIHKGHFGKPLRDMDGLCGENTVGHAKMLLLRVLSHFARVEPIHALEMMSEQEDPPSMSLVLGGTLLLNFNSSVERGSVPPMSLDGAAPSIAVLRAPASPNHTPPGGFQTMEPSGLHTSGRYSDPPPHLLFEQLAGGAPTAPAQGAKPFESLMLIDPSASGLDSTTNNPRGAPGAKYDREDAESGLLKQRTAEFFSQTSVTLKSPVGVFWDEDECPGTRLRELCVKYSFMRHAIYSVLKGRPVIVRGAQAAVRDVVIALSIFVAGGTTGQRPVELWHEAPIRMADLARLRLFGYPARGPMPKAVEKCSTLFDVDAGSLTGPAYPAAGQFIEDILAPRGNWPDEETFLAHVQEVLLHIAVKAFVFYHLCCIGVTTFSTLPGDIMQLLAPAGDEGRGSRTKVKQGSPSIGSSTPMRASLSGVKDSPLFAALPSPNITASRKSGQGVTSSYTALQLDSPPSEAEWTTYALTPVKVALRDLAKAKCLKEMDVHPGDRDILERLAEVVKDQQVSELRTQAQVAPVVLDYSAVQLFRNPTGVLPARQ